MGQETFGYALKGDASLIILWNQGYKLSLNLRVQCLASLGTKIKKIFAFKGGTTFQLERSKTLTTGKILDYLHGLLKCVTPVFHQTFWVAPA